MKEANENQNLRRAMRDLLALATMPAAWVGRSPQHIVDGLADLLVATLRAEATYVRMLLPGGERVEAMRAAEWPRLAEWLRKTEHDLASTGGRFRSGLLEASGGRKGDFRVAFNPIGWEGEGGLVVAASRRPDFPGELDWLLLSVAANQAAVAFQTARLLHQQGEANAELLRTLQAQRRTEEALQESEERFRAIVEQIAAGIAQTDMSGRFVLVNDRYCEIVGRAREELLGMRMQDITHPEDIARNAEQLAALARGGPGFSAEKRYVRPDGSTVWVRNLVSATRDSSGQMAYLTAVATDISEQKAAEAAAAAGGRSEPAA